MFTPEERAIFEYSDGSGPAPIRVDPSVVDREFRAAMEGRDIAKAFADAFFDLSELPEELRAGHEKETVLPAAEALLAAARRAFGVAPLGRDGSGLTEGETFDLLLAYGDWKEAKKASAATSPSSRPATDSDASVAASTTPPSTGSA